MWTLDFGFSATGIPPWCAQILDRYADAGRLYGHGVAYSPLGGRFTERQGWFLKKLRQECSQRAYQHVSEHFGFVGGGRFSMSAPLPVPYTQTIVNTGRDRLCRLRDAADTPVGLENLAFAFSHQDALDQSPFIEELLDEVNGFLLLDLHNLYCQIVNFGIEAEALLARYPLARVRQIHLSGGSWSMPTVGAKRLPVRRDTHDSAVPEEVMALLPMALARCPKGELVVLERLGSTMQGTAEEGLQMRSDLQRIHALVAEHAQEVTKTPSHPRRIKKSQSTLSYPRDDETLACLQARLLDLLYGQEAVRRTSAHAMCFMSRPDSFLCSWPRT